METPEKPARKSLAQLLQSRDFFMILLDLVMITLVLVNITWLVLDEVFTSHTVKSLLEQYFPRFFDFYLRRIHKDFLLFDGFFVSIFLLEFCIRWVLAVRRDIYHRWFFYPFVHWYDIMGCLPLGVLRLLRLFRLVAIAQRLEKMGVFNFQGSYLVKLVKKYYNIIVEEITDRVVIKVIEGMQLELKKGTPITERMINEVLKPHKDVLVEWVSHRVRVVVSHNYAIHKKEIRSYIYDKLEDAVQGNKEIKMLGAMPVMGNFIQNTLENAIKDIVFQVVNGLIEDLASEHNNKVLDELAEIAFDAALLQEDDRELNSIATTIATQALDIVKQNARTQQWKIDEEDELKAKAAARAAAKARKQ